MPLHVRASAFALLVLGCLVATAPADVVILKDGFVLQGNVRKEMAEATDKASNMSFQVPKANGFDMIDDGPRVVIFSTHFKQLGEISKDVKIRPDYKGYTNPFPGRKGNFKMPVGITVSMPDFDLKWHRTLKIQEPGSFSLVEQQITYIDPYSCWVVSPTHFWRQLYRTSEMDPAKVRRLLGTHPDLTEPEGKPDPLRRVAIARFMKDVGWLQAAKDEVAKLRKDIPGPLAKDAQEEFDKLLKEIDVTTGELVAGELELALAAGRYQYAADLAAAFPDKTSDAKELDRVTKVMAQVKTAREQYEAGRRLLRAVIDDVIGGAGVRAAVAAGGGPVAAVWPARTGLDPRLLLLARAAEDVYAELHPDSAGRVEFFINLAEQVQREKAAGKEPMKKPDELLATAVSAWAKGKNAATPLPDLALKVWEAREMVLAFQRAPDGSTRNAIMGRFKKSNAVGLDELAQVVSLLPPAEPENLTARSGQLLPEKNGMPPGTYKRRSAPTVQNPVGLDYFIKLPPEYHHGRAYPVLIALAHPAMDAQVVIQALAKEADKNGYILVAPDWAGPFAKGWEWKGSDHDYVTGALRDVIRHFTVDNDRVFLFGIGEGANMAMDVGVSHPDLFAGVVAMGPTVKWQGMFREYWPNAQKLPVYIVTGELAPGFQNLRLLFQEWMPKGFPALMTVYKGRGIEWYSAENPVVFDWMGRKKRPGPAATLSLGNTTYEWQSMRQGDNRFFWIGTDRIGDAHDIAQRPSPVPAGLRADLRGNNVIDLRTRGVKTVTVWLNRDMIDWAQPVRVQLDGNTPPGWKFNGKMIAPDLEVLLEDYRERGDRRMLFLAKLEFAGRN